MHIDASSKPRSFERSRKLQVLSKFLQV